MTNQDRFMAACGPLGVALMLVGNGLAGSGMPGIDASERELSDYLGDVQPAWLGLNLEILGLVALLVFCAGLSRRVEAPALRALVLAGGAAGVSLKLATALPLAAVWLRPEWAGPDVAGIALDLGSIGFAAAGGLLALVTGAAAASGVLPRWLSVLGGAATVSLLAQIPLFRQEFGLGFLLFMIWTVAAGLVLLRPRNLEGVSALQTA